MLVSIQLVEFIVNITVCFHVHTLRQLQFSSTTKSAFSISECFSTIYSIKNNSWYWKQPLMPIVKFKKVTDQPQEAHLKFPWCNASNLSIIHQKQLKVISTVVTASFKAQNSLKRQEVTRSHDFVTSWMVDNPWWPTHAVPLNNTVQWTMSLALTLLQNRQL